MALGNGAPDLFTQFAAVREVRVGMATANMVTLLEDSIRIYGVLQNTISLLRPWSALSVVNLTTGTDGIV